MAEPVNRDQTPVTVELDRPRPYRVNDSDRQAIWVGPGVCDVPRWVAEHWGLVKPVVVAAAKADDTDDTDDGAEGDNTDEAAGDVTKTEESTATARRRKAD